MERERERVIYRFIGSYENSQGEIDRLTKFVYEISDFFWHWIAVKMSFVLFSFVLIVAIVSMLFMFGLAI